MTRRHLGRDPILDVAKAQDVTVSDGNLSTFVERLWRGAWLRCVFLDGRTARASIGVWGCLTDRLVPRLDGPGTRRGAGGVFLRCGITAGSLSVALQT